MADNKDKDKVHVCPQCGYAIACEGANDALNTVVHSLWPAPAVVKQMCPICLGHGIVPHGFYQYPAGQQFGDVRGDPERCRVCTGTGTV